MGLFRQMALCLAVVAGGAGVSAQENTMGLAPAWEYVSDRVMGGVSSGALQVAEVAGRQGARLTGQVSLDNNGGFVQMAFDLERSGSFVDAAEWRGIEMDVYGNDETYEVRLRTTALTRPWQSFRVSFQAEPVWRTVRFPFADFEPHRTEATFDAAQLRRIGVLAIGRAFEADLTVAAVRFYR